MFTSGLDFPQVVQNYTEKLVLNNFWIFVNSTV